VLFTYIEDSIGLSDRGNGVSPKGVCAILLASPRPGRRFMENTKASSNPQTLPTSSSLAQTLPSDAVLDALKMILLGAP
jgi:hypothetical protein